MVSQLGVEPTKCVGQLRTQLPQKVVYAELFEREGRVREEESE